LQINLRKHEILKPKAELPSLLPYERNCLLSLKRQQAKPQITIFWLYYLGLGEGVEYGEKKNQVKKGPCLILNDIITFLFSRERWDYSGCTFPEQICSFKRTFENIV